MPAPGDHGALPARMGIEISATHHRGVTSGRLTGSATSAHLGRTLATYDVVITDERGRRVCTSRITCFLRADGPPPGGEAQPS